MRLIKLSVLTLILLGSVSIHAQNARLNFERLNYLEAKASEVVEVNIEGKMLDLAKRVLTKTNDADAK